MLTWAGLRGGISIALALTLPASPWRRDLLVVTYAVVLFTIVVQGLTMAGFLQALYGGKKPAELPAVGPTNKATVYDRNSRVY